MAIGFYYEDKNRLYKDYNYFNQVEDNCVYSRLLFHKVRWSISEYHDITELHDTWAEDIVQSIINGNLRGEFEVMIDTENDEEEYSWLNWEIMSVWNGED